MIPTLTYGLRNRRKDPMGYEVVDTPFGKFQIDPRDLIGSTLKAGTLWDGPGFLQVIAKEYAQFGEWGSTILDIGANLGSFTVYCATMGAWRVVAVEPVPETYQQLLANLDLNKGTCADAVVTLRLAAYSRRERMAIGPRDPGNRGGASVSLLQRETLGTDVVDGVPLDDYQHLYGSALQLVKIDAQGCDGAAIVGLEQTIRRHRPAIVFEWDDALAQPHGHQLHEIIARLKGFGYTVREWASHPNNFLAIAERHGNR